MARIKSTGGRHEQGARGHGDLAGSTAGGRPWRHRIRQPRSPAPSTWLGLDGGRLRPHNRERRAGRGKPLFLLLRVHTPWRSSPTANPSSRLARDAIDLPPTRPYPTLVQQQHLLLHLKAGRQAGARLTHTQHPLRHHRPTLAREVLLLATSLANTSTFACSGARHHASVHPSVPPPYELAILDSIVLSWKATRSISLAIC